MVSFVLYRIRGTTNAFIKLRALPRCPEGERKSDPQGRGGDGWRGERVKKKNSQKEEEEKEEEEEEEEGVEKVVVHGVVIGVA